MAEEALFVGLGGFHCVAVHGSTRAGEAQGLRTAVHGLARRMPDGSVTGTTSPAQLSEARRLLLAFTQTQPELIVEDKGLSLAVHFCQVPQQVAFSRRSKPTCIRL